MGFKASYVLRQAASDSKHTCHWPGCGQIVPPAMWGCKKHWFTLPKDIRDGIWRTYKPGQEISKSPSAEYLAEDRQSGVKGKSVSVRVELGGRRAIKKINIVV